MAYDFTKLKTNLERKGYEVHIFDGKEAAAEFINGQIDGKTVGFGGSVTLHQMELFEKLASTSAAPLSNNMNAAIVAIPSIVSAFSGVLPVLCYVWLANWLAYPYEKK